MKINIKDNLTFMKKKTKRLLGVNFREYFLLCLCILDEKTRSLFTENGIQNVCILKLIDKLYLCGFICEKNLG